jgi:TonB family protein
MASAFVVSLAYHAAAVLLVLLAIRSGARAGRDVSRPGEHAPAALVWLFEAGLGGGGGGGGNRMRPPPRRAELPGDAALIAAVMRPVRLEQPMRALDESNPVEHLAIPAERFASGVEALIGTMAPFALETVSQGPGRDGGAGTGENGGDGSGRDRGIGDGFDEGTGGERHRGGAGLVMPRILREVKPQYTAGAMNARIQGSVVVACIVMADGSVGDVRVTRSLDPTFGLDQEAIQAAKEWRFWPGTRLGKPVPMRVTIELAFTIR